MSSHPVQSNPMLCDGHRKSSAHISKDILSHTKYNTSRSTTVNVCLNDMSTALHKVDYSAICTLYLEFMKHTKLAQTTRSQKRLIPGLARSRSRTENLMSWSCLGLMQLWKALGLVLDWKPNVSSPARTLRSHLHPWYMMHEVCCVLLNILQPGYSFVFIFNWWLRGYMNLLYDVIIVRLSAFLLWCKWLLIVKLKVLYHSVSFL